MDASGSQHKRSRSSAGAELADDARLFKRHDARHAAAAPAYTAMGLSCAVSCGRCFSVALTSKGNVVAWGKNSAGQVGSGDESSADQPFPLLVRGLEQRVFRSVTCGNFHAMAISDEGVVWAWGSNARGRLGLGRVSPKEGTPVFIPRHVFRQLSVVQVGCGLHHSVFLLEDGSVYSTGCNENGQLGRQAHFGNATVPCVRSCVLRGFVEALTAPLKVVPAPVLLPDGVSVVRIVSGRHHVLALSSNNVLMGWGKNDVGQLGINSQTDQATPVYVLAPWGNAAIKIINAGRNHSVVATANGANVPSIFIPQCLTR